MQHAQPFPCRSEDELQHQPIFFILLSSFINITHIFIRFLFQSFCRKLKLKLYFMSIHYHWWLHTLAGTRAKLRRLLQCSSFSTFIKPRGASPWTPLGLFPTSTQLMQPTRCSFVHFGPEFERPRFLVQSNRLVNHTERRCNHRSFSGSHRNPSK